MRWIGREKLAPWDIYLLFSIKPNQVEVCFQLIVFFSVAGGGRGGMAAAQDEKRLVYRGSVPRPV